MPETDSMAGPRIHHVRSPAILLRLFRASEHSQSRADGLATAGVREIEGCPGGRGNATGEQVALEGNQENGASSICFISENLK